MDGRFGSYPEAPLCSANTSGEANAQSSDSGLCKCRTHKGEPSGIMLLCTSSLSTDYRQAILVNLVTDADENGLEEMAGNDRQDDSD